MRYLLQLPFRMARAAAVVPLHDLDRALCLSEVNHYIESMAAFFEARTEEAAA